MTIIKQSIKSERATAEADIHNWRAIKKSMGYCGSPKGGWDSCETAVLILNERTIMVWLTVDQILEFDKTTDPNHVENEVRFSTSGGIAPGYCYACGGAGKLDWVQKAMQPDPNLMGMFTENTNRFDRDLDHFLLYDVKGGQLTNQVIFAKTLLKDGEYYCERCSGTGIILDGRLTIFDGMPGIRKRLVLTDRRFRESVE
jgi:hypothetical protein